MQSIQAGFRKVVRPFHPRVALLSRQLLNIVFDNLLNDLQPSNSCELLECATTTLSEVRRSEALASRQSRHDFSAIFYSIYRFGFGESRYFHFTGISTAGGTTPENYVSRIFG